MQRLAEFVAGKLVELRLAEQERREPVGRGGERRSRQGRARLAFGAAEEVDPPAPLFERLGPRQAREAEVEDSARQRERARLVGRRAEAAFDKRQRAEFSAAARAQRGGGAVEDGLLARLDLSRRRPPRSRLNRQRRGGDDARRRGAADDLADRQKRFAGERIVRLERRGAAIGHQEFAASFPAPSRCGRETPPRAIRRRSPIGPSATFSRSREKGDPSPVRERARGEGPRAARQIPRQPPRVVGARRAVAAESLQPPRQVDRVAAEAAFSEHDGELGGEAAPRRRAPRRRPCAPAAAAAPGRRWPCLRR